MHNSTGYSIDTWQYRLSALTQELRHKPATDISREQVDGRAKIMAPPAEAMEVLFDLARNFEDEKILSLIKEYME